jgi:hypothetical protein
MQKLADLLPDVKLQPHQEAIAEESKDSPIRKLLFHGLGSGKSLSSIAASEAQGKPYTAIVPAALRENFKKELTKFTTGSTPSSVMSYSEMALGKPIEHPENLIFDEAHRLRTPGSLQTQQAMEAARRAKQLIMLSGTPIVNEPADLAVPISMLTGKNISPTEFTNRYVGERKIYPSIFHRLFGADKGVEPDVANRAELKSLLRGHVDYYAPEQSVVPVNREDHHVDMGVEQSRLYKAMWDQLPWYLRWKLKHDYPLSRDELLRMRSFMTGPRQVGLSTMPYLRNKDPMVAFQQSPKLQSAHDKMKTHLDDPRTRGLVFSNFIDAGLVPYSAALTKAGIPNAIFHGGLSDVERKKLVNNYNEGNLRVALLGPSGTEGLSFKGTNLIQILDPYWNPIRGKQSEGRGLRFDSHSGLPEDLRNVKVQRFVARLPLGFKDRLLSRLGFDKTKQQLAADDYLRNIEARKELMNRRFIELLKEVGSEGK